MNEDYIYYKDGDNYAGNGNDEKRTHHNHYRPICRMTANQKNNGNQENEEPDYAIKLAVAKLSYLGVNAKDITL